MKRVVWTTGALADAVGCTLVGEPTLELSGVMPIESAKSTDLTFLSNAKYRKHLDTTKAGGLIVSPEMKTPEGICRLETKDPYTAFCRALKLFYPESSSTVPPGIHPMAVIDPTAKIGAGAQIGPFVQIEADTVIGRNFIAFSGAYVGRETVIGDDVTLGIHSVVRHEVTIGNRVVIGDGSVIGFDGFGYAPTPAGFLKIPQVGSVTIEDDVEIGANTCIDRATIGSTSIGRGTKLDNLIQVAHGVRIGGNTVIAAQTGISGSTSIGSQVFVGGQVGFNGHIEIGDRMMIGAQAGVTKSWDIKGAISGYPAKPQMEEMRIEAVVAQLPKLLKRIQELEAELIKLKNSN